MQGIIGFEHLKIFCIIGVKPEERLQQQEIFVDLKVESDFSRCTVSGNLQQTVDYVKLAEVCTSLAQKGSYHLLENFAHHALKKLLDDFPISWAWIRVKKPNAVANAQFTFVELKRSKHE